MAEARMTNAGEETGLVICASDFIRHCRFRHSSFMQEATKHLTDSITASVILLNKEK
jgi:hypothetical protein